MLKSDGHSEDYKGSIPSVSPTAQKEGIFSLCSGGVPQQGAFARMPGKSLREANTERGGVITMYQFGDHVVVQYYTGIEVHPVIVLAPTEDNLVYDNLGNIVYDNLGIPVLINPS